MSAAKNTPKNRSGNLYYIRLNTDFGKVYKIGFTQMNSVEERFKYGGTGDHKLIDKVILFRYFPDAYDIEQRLHKALNNKTIFMDFSSIDHFILSKNGQTELYVEDVLQLDPDYMEGDGEETIKGLENHLKSSPYKTKSQFHREDAVIRKFVGAIIWLFLPVALLLVSVVALLSGDDLKAELKGFLNRLTGIARKKSEETARQQEEEEKQKFKNLLGLTSVDKETKFNVRNLRDIILRIAQSGIASYRVKHLSYGEISDLVAMDCESEGIPFSNGTEWFPNYSGLRFWVNIGELQYCVYVENNAPNLEDEGKVTISAYQDG